MFLLLYIIKKHMRCENCNEILTGEIYTDDDYLFCCVQCANEYHKP